MMCDICKRSLMANDLTTDSNGLTVCASARWCLISSATGGYTSRNSSATRYSVRFRAVGRSEACQRYV
jgi:hypothetical protein